jgi:hypothetical protein
MQREHRPAAESLVLLLCGLFLLASPFTIWWLRQGFPWWFIYLLWFLLTLATFLLARRWRHHDL